MESIIRREHFFSICRHVNSFLSEGTFFSNIEFFRDITYNYTIESDALQVSFAKPRQSRNAAAVCGTNCDWDYLTLFLRALLLTITLKNYILITLNGAIPKRSYWGGLENR